MWRHFLPAFRLTLILTILTGLLYPLAVTGLAQLLFPRRANGSMIVADGRVVGSLLIGQDFRRPEYLQPRPSAAGDGGYDASASAATNLGPTNRKLIDRVAAAVVKFRHDNPGFSGPIPADLLTTSASGLDPDVSPASAYAQAARIARARGVSIEQVEQLIARRTEGRDLGFLGEPRVNVLAFNLALDRAFPKR